MLITATRARLVMDSTHTHTHTYRQQKIVSSTARVSWRRQLLTRLSTFYSIVLNKPHCSLCEHPGSCYNWRRNNVRRAAPEYESSSRRATRMNVSFICMSSLVLIMVVTCQWGVIKRTFISLRVSSGRIYWTRADFIALLWNVYVLKLMLFYGTSPTLLYSHSETTNGRLS